MSIVQAFANKDIKQLSDSSKISLLTITPSDEYIYTLFGHTAIRISDPINSLDQVFNYGLFNFNQSGFIYRFLKGETDYIVGELPFEYFIIEYQLRGVGLIEQPLNLTTTDKQRIWEALVINAKPENREYRYNFVFDNCATRIRDIVENNIDEKIIYAPTNNEQTFRNLFHECLVFTPWSRFGIDLIIGSSADKPITDREKEFLPRYLHDSYANAKIQYPDRAEKDLTTGSYFIFGPDDIMAKNLYEITNPSSIVCFGEQTDYPFIFGCILLLVTLAISFLSYKKIKLTLGKVFDTLLFLVAGVAGLIIFFLMFISEHPCVGTNWNLVWLNPLQLLAACLFFVKPMRKCIYYYHFINFVALLLFLLAWCLIPQQLEIAFIPYILSLAIRSGSNILQYIKNKKAI